MSLQHPNPNFPNFIRKILENVLNEEHIEMLTTPECLVEFTKAFTRVSIDPIHNNEYYEIIGDMTSNKVVVDYFSKRFKHLFGSGDAAKGEMGPVAIMSRLKQRYISKTIYSKFAESLGFWEFIRRLPEEEKDKTRMCEDAFEAFIGCTEKLVEEKIRFDDDEVFEGVGFAIVKKIITPLLENLNINESDLTKETLYDPKSQLNSLYTSNRCCVDIKYNTLVNSVPEGTDPDEYKNRFTSYLEIMDLYTGEIFTTPSYNWSTKTESESLAAKYAVSNKLIENILKSHIDKGVVSMELNAKGNAYIAKRLGDWIPYSFDKRSTGGLFDFGSLKMMLKDNPTLMDEVNNLENKVNVFKRLAKNSQEKHFNDMLGEMGLKIYENKKNKLFTLFIKEWGNYPVRNLPFKVDAKIWIRERMR